MDHLVRAKNHGKVLRWPLHTQATIILVSALASASARTSTTRLSSLPALRPASKRLSPAFAHVPSILSAGPSIFSRLCKASRAPLGCLNPTAAPRARTAATMSAGYKQGNYIPGLVDSPITYEDIATFPRPGCSAPDSIFFSLDDSVVTYLASADGSLTRQLYAMDISSGNVKELCKPPTGTGEEENFSLEEKLRRERARLMHTGITSYAWAEGAEGAGKILVPIGNELFVQEGLDGELQRLFDPAVLLKTDPSASEGALPPILDARISSDGRLVAFVWNRELYVVPTDLSSEPTQLTTGARGTGLTNGLADYIAQEEMGRYEGYWMSMDSSLVAFEKVDESGIPQYRIMHQGSEEVGAGAQEDHHYPFAGTANPVVELGVVSVKGGDVTWFDLTKRFGSDIYLPRVKWLHDNTLVVQVENREQSQLELLRLFPETGEARTIMVETAPADGWINLHNMFTPLKKQDAFLWASERSGFQHLYLYDYEGNVVRQLTSGDWMVEDVKAVDEANGLVYFIGTKSGWLDRHLFCVSLEGGEVRQITREGGMHNVIIDHKRQLFVDQFSSASLPFRVLVCSLADGSVIRPLYVNDDPRLQRLLLRPPEFFTLPSLDGKVTLQGALMKPDSAVFGPGPYPTIVSVYGGPHVQTVSNSWTVTADLRAQFLRSQGYLVIKLDNRGSSRRGLNFEAFVKNNMGDLEVQDQAAGVKWAVQQGLCDPERVGIYGWSYGGYLSAIALARAPDVFRLGIAGAPVTHWDGYDTHYTERYMGTPQNNPDGYANSAVMAHVDKIDGSLLLVHGLIDENVHFRHTARLINAMIRAQKHYELLLFPDERHSPRSLKDRIFMEQRIFSFVQRTLGSARVMDMSD